MQISSVNSWTVAADFSPGAQGFFVPAAPFPSGSVAPQITADRADAVTTPAPEPSPQIVTQAVRQVNEAFTQQGQALVAAIERDQASGIDVIKVYDKETKKLVSQFPSRAIVAIAAAISESIDGKVKLLHITAY